MLHQFDAVCGKARVVTQYNKSSHLYQQSFLRSMDSTMMAPLDPVVMAQQIQALTSNVQELMKQNEDLGQRARPEGSNTSNQRHNRSRHDDEANSLENSGGRDTSEQIKQSTHGNDQMMKILRKEQDEMKKAMKGKTAINLDGMLKRTYSPFTSDVLECPLLAKFHHS